MSREKLAWVVSVGVIAVLAFQLPGSLATRDDDYAWVGTLVDIHRRVSDNYVEPVDEDTLREGAIRGMLQQLDPYTVYVPPDQREEFDRLLDGSFKGVGIQLEQDEKTLEIVVVTPIESSPAFNAGVMAGDVILKVNGEELAGLRLPDVIKKIAGPLGSPVTITVRHATGETADITMTRQEIVIPTIKGYQRRRDGQWDWYASNDPKIAYVRLTQFTPECYDKLRAVLEDLLKDGMQGLILDLRFNPGGRLDEAKEIVDLFVESGTIVVTKGRNRPEEVAYAKADGTLPHFPMAVLVNDHSASASEIVAGSLKDNKRALIVGTRTFGKGSVQELIPLDGKGELKLTVAYYYLPSGRLVHKKKDSTDWGVEPHIGVPVDQKQEEAIMLDMDRRDRPIRAASKPAEGRPDVKNSTTEPGAAPEPSTVPSPETTPVPNPEAGEEPADESLDAPNGAPDGAADSEPTTAPIAEPPTVPSPEPTTAPTTAPSTRPVSGVEPSDPQLDAAISSLIGHMVLQGEREIRK